MSISSYSPILSYVSSSDISDTGPGSTKFQIFISNTIAAQGNIIMFEYAIQTGESAPTFENTDFGFISSENAIQTGITNQWIISVPAPDNTDDGTSTQNIKIRVYIGLTGTADVEVTDWSTTVGGTEPTALDLYLPPSTPVVDRVFYDDAYYPNDNIYVYLEESANPAYDYENIKFIVCYFFQNTDSNTVWGVSEPLHAFVDPVNTAFRQLIVPSVGAVNSTPGVIYVTVHAVYYWEGPDPTSTSDPIGTVNYHSVSFVSNEVTGGQASAGAPVITSVVYNVYVAEGAEPTVPGTQTMTVTWDPPTNYLIPYYEVDYYDLYASVNGGDFNLYQAGISPSLPETTLTVNVGSTGLNLSCGDYVVYRVNAITVNGLEEPSDPSIETNYFEYSQAVTNLTISDAAFETYTTFGLTVNFDGVSDSEKGCGTGLQYVVEINGNIYSGTGSLDYVSGASYSIIYTNLSEPTIGNITVYLQTQNTNSTPSYLMDGVSLSEPYIIASFSLNPVVYDVYEFSNIDQQMQLEWSSPALEGWTVTNYELQYEVNGGEWETAINTLNNIYTFDASSYSSTITNLNFRVIATLQNNESSTQVNVTSNDESIFTFKYAEQVVDAQVNWSAGNADQSAMDVNCQFKNPSVLGTNNGLQYFTVGLYDSTDNLITSQQITYVAGSGVYTVTFDNVTYAASGYVKFESFVLDTNTTDDLTYVLYAVQAGYITSQIPEFIDVVVADGVLSGQIVSATLLAPVGQIIHPPSGGGLAQVIISTITPGGPPDGWTISHVQQETGEYLYTFALNLAAFFGQLEIPIPDAIAITVANSVGVGAHVGNLA